MEIYDLNLWQFLKKKSEQSQTVSMSDRFKIFWSIFNGLEFLHQKSLKHLDVKLSNVMIKTDLAGDFDGQNCVITDFGIGAKRDKETGMAGTPGFASPEQLISTKVGLESDLYSLGRVMIFLVAEWKRAWTLLYTPIHNFHVIKLSRHHQKLLSIVQKLLKVGNEYKHLKTVTSTFLLL